MPGNKTIDLFKSQIIFRKQYVAQFISIANFRTDDRLNIVLTAIVSKFFFYTVDSLIESDHFLTVFKNVYLIASFYEICKSHTDQTQKLAPVIQPAENFFYFLNQKMVVRSISNGGLHRHGLKIAISD